MHLTESPPLGLALPGQPQDDSSPISKQLNRRTLTLTVIVTSISKKGPGRSITAY